MVQILVPSITQAFLDTNKICILVQEPNLLTCNWYAFLSYHFKQCYTDLGFMPNIKYSSEVWPNLLFKKVPVVLNFTELIEYFVHID